MPAVRVGAVLPLLPTLGAAPGSDWWSAEDAAPAEFTTGFTDDFAALAAAGVTDVRLPFDWSRWEPSEGQRDRDVVEWYGHVLDAAADAALGAWACLWEGPLPGWFADAGGWGDASAAGRQWPRFVERVADTYGDRLAGWVPFDRPVQRLELGWLTGARPPGRRDPARLAEVTRTLLAAWRDAWIVLRGGPPVATALGVEPVEPVGESPDAGEMAWRREHHRFRLWPWAFRDGVVAAPGLADWEVPGLVGAVDVLGVTVTFDASVAVDDHERADAAVERWVEQAGDLVRRLCDEAPARPTMLTVRLRRNDADGREAGANGLVRLVQAVAGEGVDVVGAWVEPGRDGLLTPDREETGASRAVRALA